jgi:hypothetical protein
VGGAAPSFAFVALRGYFIGSTRRGVLHANLRVGEAVVACGGRGEGKRKDEKRKRRHDGAASETGDEMHRRFLYCCAYETSPITAPRTHGRLSEALNPARNLPSVQAAVRPAQQR